MPTAATWTTWAALWCCARPSLKDGRLGEFRRLATIPVDDRDRFRQTRRFRFTDGQLHAGTRYQYRIQAFTLDGDYSIPSNMVQHVWQAGS